jgi:hypothetical protein
VNDLIDFHAAAQELLAIYPESNLYFLLDHSGLPGLDAQLAKTSLSWISLFECTREENALSAAPILVRAQIENRMQISRTLCEWLGGNETDVSSILMLASPLQLEALAARLAIRMSATLPENINVLLRFFDSRVFESLTKYLNDEQLQEFLSPGNVWQYADRSSKLVRINSIFNEHDRFSSPLLLNQFQEDALMEASEIDQVIGMLRSNVPAELKKIPVNAQYHFISEKIQTGRTAGLQSVFELAFYVSVLLIEGEQFNKDAKFQHLLGQIRL